MSVCHKSGGAPPGWETNKIKVLIVGPGWPRLGSKMALDRRGSSKITKIRALKS